MDTNRFIAKARTAGETAKMRRATRKELKAFMSGGIMVFSGLLLAVAYCLVRHQLQA
jgi:hypothetical protein